MSPVLCRRHSMALLSLYDLETFSEHKIKSEVKTTPSKSVLEDLSNELLIDIFQFLSPYDLHRSFYNLNLRLNAICETQKLYLNMGWTKRAFDYYCANQQPFSSQIYSLKLDDEYDRLTLFNLHVNIDHFTNLRMLTIRKPSLENLDKILPKLHELPHLSYLNIQWALMQSSNITVSIFKIRSLKCLILCSSDPIIFHFDNNSMHPLTELEYLDVDDCHTTEFLELLKYIGPNVGRIKIRLCYHSQQDLTSLNPTIIDELLATHGIPVFLHCLEMKFNFFSLTNFHLILRLFPHLTHLTFSTLTNDINFISPSIWYEFISTNLLELKQLQFCIEVKGLLRNVIQCPSTDLIDSFYSMHNQWLTGPVVMDYNSLLTSPVLEFYTSPQSIRIGKYSLKLYGKKRYMITPMTDVSINIDKNITDLHIILSDNQQMATTIDQLSIYETNGTYPKVTRITVHSQITNSSVENEKKISLIISDIIKSIPDLSKITSLNFTTDSSIYPSTILTRRLLSKLPKVKRLELSYNYLLCLIKLPLIVNILSKKIETLTIIFDTDPPMLPDMIRILKIFSLNLCFLYFDIRIDFPSKKFYFILPPLFSGICKKLYGFRLRLCTRLRQQSQVFDEQFKLRLKNCLTAQVEKNKTKSGTMEYRIKDNEVSISF